MQVSSGTYLNTVVTVSKTFSSLQYTAYDDRDDTLY